MKNKPIILRALAAVCLLSSVLCSAGCASPGAAPADTAAQVAKISAAVEGFSTAGASFYLVKNKASAPYLLAAASIIEASANAGTLDPAAVQTALARQLEPEAAQAIGSALGGAFGLYQAFVGANVDAALDTSPAFKAVLLALARGVRTAASGVPASSSAPALRIPEDLVLR